MTTSKEQNPRGLWLIGIVKLVYALLLAAASFGAFRLVNQDIGVDFEHFIMHLHLDPGNKMILKTTSFISGINEQHLRVIGFGTLAYAVLDLIEGVGLMLRRRWAEYLTIIITGSLLPLECYELFHKFTTLRLTVLALNLVIVAYLVKQLRKQHP